jgi:two-component system cell cycle sensor histidine kinase PleC
LTGNVPAGLPSIEGDEPRLKQVLLNLLSNAIKFTPEGGSVSVSAELAGDGETVITVTDKGIGMDGAAITRALERFGQTHNDPMVNISAGTGLGLPLARELIEAHGGHLQIFSQPGQGTRVAIHLPRREDG